MSMRSSRPRRASLSAMASADSPDRPSNNAGPNPSSNATGLFSSSPSVPSNTYRNPARSFVSQSPLTSARTLSFSSKDKAPTNMMFAVPAEYASAGVREQTEELASYTFSKSSVGRECRPGPFPPSTKPSQTYGHTISQPSSPGGQDVYRPSETDFSQLPETIEEHSEPTSPISFSPSASHPHHPDPEGPESSALSSMFRKPSSDGSVSQRPTTSRGDYQQRPDTRIPKIVVGQSEDNIDEQEPLLPRRKPLPQSSLTKDAEDHKSHTGRDLEDQKPFRRKRTKFRQLVDEAKQNATEFASVAGSPKRWSRRSVWEQGVKQPISLIPCVFLGLLLNVLDALSYGL